VIVPEQAARTLHRPAVQLDLRDVTRILGRTEAESPLGAATIERYLIALGCRVQKSSDAGALSVDLPSWRLDLERDIDLIEEIARLHGYNRFANTLPAFSGSVVELPNASKERTVRRKLLAAGYTETVFSSFCSAADAATFAPQHASVPLGNPLSEEAGHLRPSLLPGMLAMLAHNLNHGVDAVRIFEMGTVFSGTTDRVDERPSLAIGATGMVAASAHTSAREYSFYDMKGIVEELLAGFTAASFSFVPIEKDAAWLHPGRAARMVLDGETLGYFGQIAEAESAQRKLKQPVFVGEIDLQRLFQQSLRLPAIQPLSRFPAVARDFSFVFADSMDWEQIATTLATCQIPEMRPAAALEIFRDVKGKTVPHGSYSLLLRVIFQSQERTLHEEEIQNWSEQVIAALTKMGGVLRSG